MLDINAIRKDFPILEQKVYGKPLAYFDNGATTQKPKVVLDTIARIYSVDNSNIHRGVHYLSEQMTELYEEARRTIQSFINAEFSQEIIFTAGTTASINLVAFSFGERFVKEGDEVIVSAMEHHANIVPWQMMCERKKAKLRVIPITDKGELILDEYKKLLNERTRIVAVTHVSNTLGTVNLVKEIINLAHEKNIPVLIDGAQSIQHKKIDVQELGCDFFAFSGHKIYGPTGIGILYGRHELLNDLPPYMGGGDMVDCVKFERTTYNDLPFKFEAGTTNYVDAVAMAEAVKYIQDIGIENIAAREQSLLNYATEKLKAIDNLRIFGEADEKGPIISLLVGNIHPYDMGMIIDKMGVAVRTGTHCSQPLMDRYGIEGTLRVSMAFYNTEEEIDRLVDAIKRAAIMLS
jgi:cysteine desulfurase/selenocysteine lyase